MKVFVCGMSREGSEQEGACETENFVRLGENDIELTQQLSSCSGEVAYLVTAAGLENVARRQIALAIAADPEVKVGLLVHDSLTAAALLADCMAIQPSALGALKAWHFLGERMEVWVWTPRVGRLAAPNAPLSVVARSWFTSRGCLAQPVSGGVLFPVPKEGGVLPWEPWPSDAWVAVPQGLPQAPERLLRDRGGSKCKVVPASWCGDVEQRYGDNQVRELVVVKANTGVATWEWTTTWQCHGCGEDRVGQLCAFCNALPKPDCGMPGAVSSSAGRHR